MGCLFFYENLIRDGTLTASSEHSNFPAENAITRIPPEAWHSNHGAGSGWGNFIITAGVNDRLDFDEGGAALAALLTPGAYDADTLSAHLKAQMEAVGAGTYTWSYVETGTYINKFKVVKSAGTLNLLWTSGVNVARSIADSIGFTADDTGALTYYADEIRIHTEEWLKVDLLSAQSIYGIFIKNHNFQAGATVKIQLDNDPPDWTAPPINRTLTINEDIMGFVWSGVQSYRWARLLIQDVDNPDGYVKVGIWWLGDKFEPTRNIHFDYDYEPNDPSVIKQSSGGNISTILLDKYNIRNYFFNGSLDYSEFKEMFDTVGFAKELFFVRDDAAFTESGGGGGADFSLRWDSPARDAGVDVGLTEDYAGAPVPAGAGVDIGAYEYQPGISSYGGPEVIPVYYARICRYALKHMIGLLFDINLSLEELR